MDLGVILDAVSNGGTPALLIVILMGGAKGWWVFGRQYEDVVKQRDRLLEIALEAAETANRAASVAEQTTTRRRGG